jgi:hypothetical protein
MSLPLFISGILLLQLAGCAMGRDAQSSEAAPETAAVAAGQQPAVTVDAVVSLPPAGTTVAAPVASEAVAPEPVAAPEPVPATAGAAPAEALPAPVPVKKPVTATPEKPVAKPPAKTAAPARTPQKTIAPPVPASQSIPAMALATLEQRLKDTSAIGVFTKLALKNQVDDLVSRVRAHHDGAGNSTAQLRQAYDQLLAKVHGLLKDGDPALANAIMASRESIWLVLMDPVKFAKL